MRVFALTLASLALLVPFAGCGGKTLLVTGGLDASVSTPDAPGSMPGCPDPPVTGGTCSTPGMQCSQAVCGVLLPCTCTGGAWECKGTSCGGPEPDASAFFPDATVPCPAPTEVAQGGSCPAIGVSCNESVCDGTEVASCVCSPNGWQCEGVSCAAPEPDSGIIISPPFNCAVGASCAGGPSSCVLDGEGPCGSNVLLGCLETSHPTYAVISYPCSGGLGCGTAGGDGSCSESCQCTNGNMVCTGNCDGGL